MGAWGPGSWGNDTRWLHRGGPRSPGIAGGGYQEAQARVGISPAWKPGVARKMRSKRGNCRCCRHR